MVLHKPVVFTTVGLLILFLLFGVGVIGQMDLFVVVFVYVIRGLCLLPMCYRMMKDPEWRHEIMDSPEMDLQKSRYILLRIRTQMMWAISRLLDMIYLTVPSFIMGILSPHWMIIFLWDMAITTVGYGDGMESVRETPERIAKRVLIGACGLAVGLVAGNLAPVIG